MRQPADCQPTRASGSQHAGRPHIERDADTVRETRERYFSPSHHPFQRLKIISFEDHRLLDQGHTDLYGYVSLTVKYVY